MKAYTLFALVPIALSSPLTSAAQDLQQNIQSQPSMGAAQEHIDKMEAHMKEMSKDMAEIRLLLDPYERKVRLQRHMQSMAKMMRQMHRIRQNMSPPETAARLQMLEKRVDMLQYLINQTYLPADYAYLFTKESFKSRAYNNLHANLTCLHFFNYLISLNFYTNFSSVKSWACML